VHGYFNRLLKLLNPNIAKHYGIVVAGETEEAAGAIFAGVRAFGHDRVFVSWGSGDIS
jgi:hypothetical protein